MYLDCSYTITPGFGMVHAIILVQTYAIIVNIWSDFALEVLPWDLCYDFLLHISLRDWNTCQVLATVSVIMTLVFRS